MDETKLVEILISKLRANGDVPLDQVMSDIWKSVSMQAFLSTHGRSFATYAKAQHALTKALRVYMYG
jgi:hypothetical protein